jgi:hypothetical protein
MGLYNKIKWVLGIVLVFVLILTTNLIDRNNFSRVRDSVVSIYEDRLIAKELIYDISKGIYQKQAALLASDSIFFKQSNASVNAGIENALTRFEGTKLTQRENKIFTKLKRDLEQLQIAEKSLMAGDFSKSEELLSEIRTVIERLDALSDIQLEEGRRQKAISERALENIELFTQLEIYVLIFLALMIQLIVMYQPKKKTDS